MKRIRILFSLLLAVSVPAFEQRASPSQRSTNPPSSASAITRAYVNALMRDDLSDFWKYSATYNQMAQTAIRNLPSSMWPSKLGELRIQVKQNIEVERYNSQSILYRPAWVYVRRPAQVRVLETRPEGGSWISFVVVTFPTEGESPRSFLEPRPLRSYTISFRVVRDGSSGRLLVDDSRCNLLQETISYWPVPKLSHEVALTLLKGSHPQPTAALKEASAFSIPDIFDDDMKENMLPMLARYGLKLVNLHKVKCDDPNCQVRSYLRVDAIEAADSWKPYLVDETKRAYALAERVSYELGELEYVSDDHARASFTISFLGCTPICGLIEDLDYPRNSFFFSKHESRFVWGQTLSKEAHFRWDHALREWKKD